MTISLQANTRLSAPERSQMVRRTVYAALAAALVTFSGLLLMSSREQSKSRPYAEPPVTFVENRGQVPSPVEYYVQNEASTVYFMPDALVVSLRGEAAGGPADFALRIELLGADPMTAIRSLTPAEGVVNILRGDDPAGWITDIPTHSRIAYRQPWQGIDLTYQGRDGRLESVFTVHPGADPAAIRLRYWGQDRLNIDSGGNLIIETPPGELIETRPVLYQEIGGERIPVTGRYVLLDPRTVAFDVGSYDRSYALIIDPTLVYSTYLGGSGSDQGNSIAVDGSGNAYIAGLTTSTNFPTTIGSLQTASAGDRDAFVTKLDATGSLVYSTYIGGSGFDQANDLAIDSSGNAYIAGITASADFPTVAGAQPLFGGGEDAFVAKLNAAGSALVYSTYLGGSDDDEARGIALDGSGNTYITGSTLSTNFPVLNAAQPSLVDDDAFVTKLNAAGSAFVYSTYLGGFGGDVGRAIAVDGTGSAFVTGSTLAADFPIAGGVQSTSGGGRDAFVTKLSPTGNAFTYSTYLGGSATDHGFGIAVDGSGNAVVAGLTGSANFPTANALQAANAGGDDAFVTKLNAAGSALIFSTYLGGSAGDGASSVSLDNGDNVYLTGSTFSSDFPTVGEFQSASGGGSDGFVAKLSAAGATLSYSTYLGGASGTDRGWDVAVDASGDAYVTGSSLSTDFPLLNAAQGAYAGLGDAFVAKVNAIAPPATPTPSPTPAPTPKNPDGDTDGDTILNSADPDDDNDGCTDIAELQTAIGSQTTGGLRDPHNFWDLFDPSLDRSVAFTDFLLVLQRFGTIDANGTAPINRNSDPLTTPDPGPGIYHPRFDRGGQMPGGDPWDELPADGAIGFGDFLSILRQFGHSCG